MQISSLDNTMILSMIRNTNALEYSVRLRSSAEIRFTISSVLDFTALECSAEASIRFFCCFNLRMASLLCFSLWSMMSFSLTARASSRSNSVSKSLILFSIIMGLTFSFFPGDAVYQSILQCRSHFFLLTMN